VIANYDSVRVELERNVSKKKSIYRIFVVKEVGKNLKD
jgi:hypothetical protein